MTRRTNWIISLVIVVAFVVLRSRHVPSAPYPTTAQTVGNEIHVPVVKALPTTPAETWSLVGGAGGHIFINVYNQQRLVQRFPTGIVTGHTAGGTDYKASGVIDLDGRSYTLESVHVNADQKGGFATLVASAPKK